MARIIWGQATDRGLIRSVNEDALFACNMVSQTEHPMSVGLFIVADGMGGAKVGAHASRLAISITSSLLMQSVIIPMLSEQAYSPIPEALTTAIQEANDEIVRQQELDEWRRGMGSTVDVALVIENKVYFGHLGDSRAYVITQDAITQLTEDHTFVNTLIRMGHITREDASTHPIDGGVYRALGQSGNTDIDLLTQELDSNSSLLLCTDGLTRFLSPEQIVEIVRNSPEPQQACNRLVALAKYLYGTRVTLFEGHTSSD